MLYVKKQNVICKKRNLAASQQKSYMVSSGYSDSQNVDLWTNLTKSRIFSTGAHWTPPDHQ